MIANGNDVAVLYDCDLATPVGTLRFAEFIRVDGDRISQDRLIFDTFEVQKDCTAGVCRW